MKLSAPLEEVSVEIRAPRDLVWNMITDVTRMGEWSPVCYRCEWLDRDEVPRLGARFVGYNKQGLMRWSRECKVTVFNPEHEFGFSTFFKGKESTRWLYRFEQTQDGTKVTEAYEPVSAPKWISILAKIPGVQARIDRDHREGMKQTLSRVRRAAENV